LCDLGAAIAGTLAILMGLLVLMSGRNLWMVIIGHGLFDASRLVLLYFQGGPSWLILSVSTAPYSSSAIQQARIEFEINW
jgi:hypothetical protein